MNFPRPPPAPTCLLAGPWHDSHPLTEANFTSSFVNRPCALMGKLRTIFEWQSTQVALPTKCAPSMSGGATTVRCTLEQAIKSDAPNAAAASTQNSVHHRACFISHQSLWRKHDPPTSI